MAKTQKDIILDLKLQNKEALNRVDELEAQIAKLEKTAAKAAANMSKEFAKEMAKLASANKGAVAEVERRLLAATRVSDRTKLALEKQISSLEQKLIASQEKVATAAARAANNSISSWAIFVTGVNQALELLSKAWDWATAIFSRPLQEASLFEQFRTTLKVLLGDIDEAEARFKQLINFAAVTPFTVPGIVEAGNQLQAVGRFSLDTIRMLGDLASASGRTVAEAIEAYINMVTGRTGYAVRQFRMMLIATQDWTREIGKQVLKTGGGAIATVEEMVEALPKIVARKNFTGMMEEQVKTFKGMMSNLEDYTQQALARFGDYYLDNVKDIIAWVTKTAQNVRDHVEDITDTVINLGLEMALIFSVVKWESIVVGFAAMMTKIVALARTAWFNITVLYATNPIGIWLVGIGTVILGIKEIADLLSETTEQILRNAEAEKGLVDELIRDAKMTKSLEEDKMKLLARYSELYEEQKKLNKPTDEYLDIVAQLRDLYPEMINSANEFVLSQDSIAQAVDNASNAIRMQVSEIAKQTVEQKKHAVAIAESRSIIARERLEAMKDKILVTPGEGKGAVGEFETDSGLIDTYFENFIEELETSKSADDARKAFSKFVNDAFKIMASPEQRLELNTLADKAVSEFIRSLDLKNTISNDTYVIQLQDKVKEAKKIFSEDSKGFKLWVERALKELELGADIPTESLRSKLTEAEYTKHYNEMKKVFDKNTEGFEKWRVAMGQKSSLNMQKTLISGATNEAMRRELRAALGIVETDMLEGEGGGKKGDSDEKKREQFERDELIREAKLKHTEAMLAISKKYADDENELNRKRLDEELRFQLELNKIQAEEVSVDDPKDPTGKIVLRSRDESQRQLDAQTRADHAIKKFQLEETIKHKTRLKQIVDEQIAEETTARTQHRRNTVELDLALLDAEESAYKKQAELSLAFVDKKKENDFKLRREELQLKKNHRDNLIAIEKEESALRLEAFEKHKNNEDQYSAAILAIEDRMLKKRLALQGEYYTEKDAMDKRLRQKEIIRKAVESRQDTIDIAMNAQSRVGGEYEQAIGTEKTAFGREEKKVTDSYNAEVVARQNLSLMQSFSDLHKQFLETGSATEEYNAALEKIAALYPQMVDESGMFAMSQKDLADEIENAQAVVNAEQFVDVYDEQGQLIMSKEQMYQLVIEEMKRRHTENLKDITLDYYENELDKAIGFNSKMKQATMQSLSNIGDAFSSMYRLRSEAGRKEADEYKESEMERLDAEYAGLRESARTSKQKQAVEEEYQAKKEEIEKRADERAKEAGKTWFAMMKATQIAQATIQMVSGAVAAQSDIVRYPPPFNTILAASIVAAGLANIAVISAQEPGYKKGGYTGRGDEDETVVAHKGEYIFEKRIAEANLPELERVRKMMQAGVPLKKIIGKQDAIEQKFDSPRDVRDAIARREFAIRQANTMQKFLTTPQRIDMIGGAQDIRNAKQIIDMTRISNAQKNDRVEALLSELNGNLVRYLENPVAPELVVSRNKAEELVSRGVSGLRKNKL